MDVNALAADYQRDGYVGGVKILNAEEVAEHRAALEWAEAERGNVHFKAKLHTVMTSPLEMATSEGLPADAGSII